MTKMTKTQVKAAVVKALKDQGLAVPQVTVEWLGKWSPLGSPLKGDEPDAQFRCARVTLSAGAGGSTTKSFTTETDGSWMLR